MHENEFLGLGGITHISWENRIGEISLILHPNIRGKNLGGPCADALLEDAFDRMGLKTVFGECYMCNNAHKFWEDVCEKYGGFSAILPNRKFWNGRFWGAYYFSIDVDQWKKNRSR